MGRARRATRARRARRTRFSLGSELHQLGAKCVFSVVSLLLCPPVALAQLAAQAQQPATQAQQPAATPATPVSQLYGPVPLVRIMDGDTLVVESNIGPRTVRLIGVNAPEVSPAEPGGREAAAYLARLLGPGMLIWLELDLAVEDPFGRLLAYVYVPDANGTWQHAGMRVTQVNLAMVAAGWARAQSIEPNVTYADLYWAAAQDAEAQERGMWAQADTEPAAADDPAAMAQAAEDAAAGATQLLGTPVTEEESERTTAGAALPIRLHCGLLNPVADNDVGEWVSVMLNQPMDTRGYYLYDEGSGSRFRLPAGVQPAGEIRVMNPGQGVWNNSGDVVYLMLGNEVVDTWEYEGYEARSGVVVCRH